MLPNSEATHLITTSLIGLILFAKYRSWKLLPICFIGGFLIDIDHWFDYLLYFGLKINIANFFNVSSYMDEARKVYVLLHGWEYIPILYILGRLLERRYRMRGMAWALSLPYFFHLIIDNFSYYHHPLAYSLIFRLLSGFNRANYLGIGGV